jgi:hypothetical protein
MKTLIAVAGMVTHGAHAYLRHYCNYGCLLLPSATVDVSGNMRRQNSGGWMYVRVTEQLSDVSDS